MNSFSIIIADDHTMIRQGIRRIIESSKDMVVAGEASSGLELLKLLKTKTADLVILDISMLDIRGIEATSEIRASHPEVKVLILTMHKRKEYLYNCFSAGASGYLLKEDTDTELFSAIDTIRRGDIYLSPILSRDLTVDLLEICQSGKKPPGEILSPREIEVTKLVAEGNSNKEVADLLCISVRTVHQHRANIMGKLGLKNVTNLVKYAIRKGYTDETS